MPTGEMHILIFSQDKTIFCSSQLNESCWTVNRELTLWSKELEFSLMVSVFVSCAFGTGMEITEDDLVKTHGSRLNKVFTDKVADMHLFGSDSKGPLIESPFLRYPNYG